MPEEELQQPQIIMVEALERADDMLIALEIRKRETSDSGERTELDDFIREQGYDPAELGA